LDVITFGETMVLFTPDTTGPLRFVDRFSKTIGGAESNFAIGLARLGHQVSWFSRLGNDEFGVYVRNLIRGEGVDTSSVIFDDLHPTAVFFKERKAFQESSVYYYRSHSAASFLSPDDIDEKWIGQAKVLHITGITPALSETCRAAVFKAVDSARKLGVTVVFDPNIRLKLWSRQAAREVLLEVAKRVDIVLPGLDEGTLLTGEDTPEGVAQHFLAHGVKGVVVKLGERGAYYATGDERAYVAGQRVDRIVDPLGAGDAFAAGFVSGLLRGWSYHAAITFANRVAAYALTVVGDFEGLPTWSEVDPHSETKQVLR